jgi:hypothetical protein
MTKDTRQFLSLITLGLIGLVLILTESHRHLLAWAWPFAMSFYNTHIAF